MSSNAQTTSDHIQSYCMYVRAYLTILHYEPSHFGGSDMVLMQELSNRRLVRSGADCVFFDTGCCQIYPDKIPSIPLCSSRSCRIRGSTRIGWINRIVISSGSDRYILLFTVDIAILYTSLTREKKTHGTLPVAVIIPPH